MLSEEPLLYTAFIVMITYRVVYFLRNTRKKILVNRDENMPL